MGVEIRVLGVLRVGVLIGKKVDDRCGDVRGGIGVF